MIITVLVFLVLSLFFSYMIISLNKYNSRTDKIILNMRKRHKI